MSIIQNYINIKNEIKNLNPNTKLIVVSKSQDIERIKILLDYGHLDFGENKIQEAIVKWSTLLSNYKNINLHLIGKLQSNKAKDAFNIFNFIHTLDNEKLAKILSNLEEVNNKKINYFVQVNIGDEPQKNGIIKSKVSDFIKYCKFDLKLNILGLMCLPPINENPDLYFKKLKEFAINNKLKDLSMGMSADYKAAATLGATYLRIGTSIFGKRSNQF
jgi:pyridoxal phosphate enzyme (YggS family)